MKKKCCSLLLVICLIIGTFAVHTAVAEESMLYDNSSNEYYAKFLDSFGIYSFLNEDDVFFNDTKPVLRYEAAKALITLWGDTPETVTGSVSQYFVDVPDFHSESAVIATAVNRGFMSGVGTGYFAPEAEIKVEHFLKSLVVALGYEHEAVVKGGYPNGYILIANRLELLENVECTVSDVLTREMLVKILYNAVSADICIPVALSGEKTTYRIEQGVTLLTHYHDIEYIEDEVINSNQIMSLKSKFEPKSDVLLIGDQMIYTDNGEIFNYVGYRVNCYVKENDGIKTLVYFELCEDNEVYVLSARDVITANSESVEFEKENGKEETINISNSAQIFLNGKLVTEKIDKYMNDFSGSMTIVDNNDDEEFDVVFIENYIYEKVDYVSPEKEVVYFEDSSFSYSKKKIAIKGNNESGSDIESLASGTVVGIAYAENSDTAIIHILGNPTAITVDEISDEYITSTSGETYYLSDEIDKDDMTLLKPTQNLAIAVNDAGEIVWISEEADAASVGFLIKAVSEKKSFDTRVAFKILGTDNVVTVYEVNGDKLRIDGKTVKKEDIETYLINSKNQLNITADGATSQVIYYVLNDARELVSIYTAKNDESGRFMLSYNYKEDGKANLRDHGYRSAVFAYRNALTRDVPIFQVPLENIESYDDEFFNVVTYTPQEFTDGGSFEFDSYITDESDIIPDAVVYYKTTLPVLSKDSDFFLVEKISTALNDEGDPAIKVKGYYHDKEVTYFANDTSNLSFADVDSGDIITVALDAINNITGYELVYDLSTDTVNPDYVGASIDDTVAVRVLHVYNAPKGSEFVKTYYGGFKDGVPGEENAVLFNFIPYTRTNSGLYSYDVVNKKGKLMEPERLTDYQHDSENYSKIVIRYRREYQMNAVIYY